uniref:Cysteine proteinase 3 n=1 Tax=Lygus hesperus TaxID=30085 RepID=A0A0A9WNU3_LYGHE
MYATHQVFDRLENFKKNVDFVLNSNNQTKEYTLGLNQFADWSLEEFDDYLLKGFRIPHNYQVDDSTVTETGVEPRSEDGGSSSSSSSIDSDEENGERSEKSVFIRPLPVSQPDEDWDVLEPPTSLSDYHFSDRGLQHPFVPEFTETCDLNVHFMQYLQLVPERIRNSPFYYHRIDTSASSKRSSVRKFSKVDIAEGQFDD